MIPTTELDKETFSAIFPSNPETITLEEKKLAEVDILDQFQPIKLIYKGENMPTARIVEYVVELPLEMQEKRRISALSIL